MLKRIASALTVVVTFVAVALWVSPGAAFAAGPYLVRPRANLGVCLNNPHSSLVNNTQMIIYTCSPSGAEDNERWEFVPSINFSSGWWLENEISNKCLTTKNGDTVANTVVLQFTCNDNGNEVWKPSLAQKGVDGKDFYVLSPENAGDKCLAPLNSNTTSGTGMVIQQCTYSYAQQWTW